LLTVAASSDNSKFKAKTPKVMTVKRKLLHSLSNPSRTLTTKEKLATAIKQTVHHVLKATLWQVNINQTNTLESPTILCYRI